MATSDVVIREVVPGVLTTFSKPFKRFGIFPVGGRSTAIKLSNGSVWILASTPLDTPTKTTLDRLGPVDYIAIVDIEHCMYTQDYVKAYPNARVIGPQGSKDKTRLAVNEFSVASTASRREQEEDHNRVMGVSQQQQQQQSALPSQQGSFSILDEIKVEYFSGFTNKDIAFFHQPTKSLVVGDLLFNLPCTECSHSSNSNSSPSPSPSSSSPPSRWSSLFPKNLGSGYVDMKPGSMIHKWFVYKSLAVDKAAMAKSASRVKTWNFDRIIPCHGDVIDKDAKKAWEDTYQNYFDDIKAGKLPAHDEL